MNRLIDVYITAVSLGRLDAAGNGVKDYREMMIRACTWAETGNCRGALIFTDHYSLDPWLVAQHLIERTESLIPLVAAQPPYVHPFTVARFISSIAVLYGRRVDINLVTGGNREHLASVGSTISHDERYQRLIEFARAIGALLVSSDPVDMNGTYYQLNSAYLHPPLRPDMFPRFFAGGSSQAACDAARKLRITRLQYPRDLKEYPPGATDLTGTGIRVGIIARDTTEQAWRVAKKRFPPNRNGERRTDITAPVIDSTWWHRLLEDSLEPHAPDSPYWIYPLRGHGEYCPYLVGDHQTVAEYLARYLDLGITTLILQRPQAEEDVPEAMIALEQAERLRSPVTAQPAKS